VGINTAKLLFDTVAEYDEEITAVRGAIRRQMMIGSGNMNNSGGSSRSMTEAELSQVRNYLEQLRRERSYLVPSAPCDADFLMIGASW